MKLQSPQRSYREITSSRWLAYAAASAATALIGAAPSEAEIHYSGRVEVEFPPDEYKSVAFPLDRPGDSISFSHGQDSVDFFAVRCPRSGAFVGSNGEGFEAYYVFRLGKRNANQYISEGPFTAAGLGNYGALGTMVRGDSSFAHWRWNGRGVAFVGFRFNNGSGNQYGWARVRMDGPESKFSFAVIDYAWADVGESIKPGQKSSSDTNVQNNSVLQQEGSIGLLAFGAAGISLWRRKRSGL
jgi:hypothetical protein